MKLFVFVLTLVVAALPARAISVIDFTTHPCGGLVVCTVPLSGGVYDGVIATIDSPVVEVPASSTGTVLYNLSNGLALGSGVFATSWNISFDRDVFWVGGTAYASSFDLGLDIAGPGGPVATALLASAGIGPFELPTPIMFSAGETYTFSTLHRFTATSALPSNTGVIAFTLLNFDVPEASTLALLLPGLAGLGWLARRRRPYR